MTQADHPLFSILNICYADYVSMDWKSYFVDWPIDDTLTPETANERGYVWVNDVYYVSLLGDQTVLRDIVEMVTKSGYKLGRPVAIPMDDGVGIYSIQNLREILEQSRNSPQKKIRA